MLQVGRCVLENYSESPQNGNAGRQVVSHILLEFVITSMPKRGKGADYSLIAGHDLHLTAM
jgi:hypothetical protein